MNYFLYQGLRFIFYNGFGPDANFVRFLVKFRCILVVLHRRQFLGKLNKRRTICVICLNNKN